MNTTMKWFMSYVQVWRDGTRQYASCVIERNEHPVVTILRWNEAHYSKQGAKCILLSFQQVPDDTPEMDLLSAEIS